MLLWEAIAVHSVGKMQSFIIVKAGDAYRHQSCPFLLFRILNTVLPFPVGCRRGFASDVVTTLAPFSSLRKVGNAVTGICVQNANSTRHSSYSLFIGFQVAVIIL
jgi:hypothetical protein